MPVKPRDLSERLWAGIDVRGPDDCWLWKGERDGKGYGVFCMRFRNPRIRVRAHRFAYETRVGPIPDGLLIMHTCDVPLCCNPRHLQPGTQLDNMRDAAAKGRTAQGDRAGWVTKPERVARGVRHMSRTRPESMARGDRHGFRLHPEKLCRGQNRPQAKLNDDSVREIRRRRAEGETQRGLALEFHVSEATISNVVNFKMSWKHVA